MRAIIKRVTHGRFKGQYRFILTGVNHEIIATSELYSTKQNVIEVIEAYFKDFIIVDKSK